MNLREVALEDIACVVILMFFGMAGAIPGIAPNQANEMTGAGATPFQTLAGIGSQMLIDLLIAALVLRHGPSMARASAKLQWAGALSLFAILSVLWSQDAVLTGRRAIPFALAAVFGMYLPLRYPLARQLALLQAAFLGLALGSAALALGLPSMGLDASNGHAGDWQGVFTQKNACGRAMVFASAVVLSRGQLTLARTGALVIFLGVLGMSGSRGAWVIEAVLFATLACFYLLTRFERARRSWLLGFLLGCIACTGLFAKLYFSVFAEMLGRDATLTGRTAIWEQVWIAIWRHPWLGYGFSAFWRGAKGASFDVVVALKFVLFHAHNGFLEIWLELGAVGLALFALSYVRGWRRLWVQVRSGRSLQAAWPLCLLVLIAAYDFDENTLLSFNGLFWVLYVGALVQIESMGALYARDGAQVGAGIAERPVSDFSIRAGERVAGDCLEPFPAFLKDDNVASTSVSVERTVPPETAAWQSARQTLSAREMCAAEPQINPLAEDSASDSTDKYAGSIR